MKPSLDKRSKSLTAKFNACRWPEAKIWAGYRTSIYRQGSELVVSNLQHAYFTLDPIATCRFATAHWLSTALHWPNSGSYAK